MQVHVYPLSLAVHPPSKVLSMLSVVPAGGCCLFPTPAADNSVAACRSSPLSLPLSPIVAQLPVKAPWLLLPCTRRRHCCCLMLAVAVPPTLPPSLQRHATFMTVLPYYVAHSTLCYNLFLFFFNLSPSPASPTALGTCSISFISL